MYMNNSVENKRKSDSQKLYLNFFFYRKFINQNAKMLNHLLKCDR